MSQIRVMTNELKSKIENLRSLNTQFKNAVTQLECCPAN